jgi:hypothetical protein
MKFAQRFAESRKTTGGFPFFEKITAKQAASSRLLKLFDVVCALRFAK